jgi:hypothetical protein
LDPTQQWERDGENYVVRSPIMCSIHHNNVNVRIMKTKVLTSVGYWSDNKWNWESLGEKSLIENIRIDGRIILKWIEKNLGCM